MAGKHRFIDDLVQDVVVDEDKLTKAINDKEN